MRATRDPMHQKIPQARLELLVRAHADVLEPQRVPQTLKLTDITAEANLRNKGKTAPAAGQCLTDVFHDYMC